MKQKILKSSDPSNNKGKDMLPIFAGEITDTLLVAVKKEDPNYNQASSDSQDKLVEL